MKLINQTNWNTQDLKKLCLAVIKKGDFEDFKEKCRTYFVSVECSKVVRKEDFDSFEGKKVIEDLVKEIKGKLGELK